MANTVGAITDTRGERSGENLARRLGRITATWWESRRNHGTCKENTVGTPLEMS